MIKVIIVTHRRRKSWKMKMKKVAQASPKIYEHVVQTNVERMKYIYLFQNFMGFHDDMKIHDFSNCIEIIDCHGIHRNPWIPWKSMEYIANP